MGKRKPITATTIAAVASENAGHPLDDERAMRYADALEPILNMIAGLRSLPLKEIEPACIFNPEPGDSND